MSNAILNARLILSLCLGTIRTPATLQARANGTRVLNTVVTGIEDYVVRALLDVDYDAMIRNAERMGEHVRENEGLPHDDCRGHRPDLASSRRARRSSAMAR